MAKRSKAAEDQVKGVEPADLIEHNGPTEAKGLADPEVNLRELGQQYRSVASAIIIDSAEGERAAAPALGDTGAAERTDQIFIKAAQSATGKPRKRRRG